MITSTTITNYLRMAASLLLLFASNHRVGHHKNILVERVRPTEPKFYEAIFEATHFA
jgi:hypothetical protein